MNKFWWSVIMIAAIVIVAIIDIKTMPIWVVIVNVALGIVAAFAAFRIGKIQKQVKVIVRELSSTGENQKALI